MKPIRLAVLTLTLLPLVSLAAPPEANDDTAHDEKQARMMRVLGLAEELELNETQALKMADTMRQFDERRRPLMEQVRESAQVLRTAAQGDTAAQSQVDQAVQRVFDARTQLTALDRDMYQALAKDLPPQKRAQLAIFMARHEGRMVKLLRKMDREGRSEERQKRMQERMQERMQRMQERMQQRGTGGQ
jgi:Spy/CpxP family protein refolding chaperone